MIAAAHTAAHSFQLFHKALWGAAGAGVWLLLVFALPACYRVARGAARIDVVDWQQAVGALGVALIILVLGAVAPFVMGAKVGKEALGYGLGWQGVLGEYARMAGFRKGGAPPT